MTIVTDLALEDSSSVTVLLDFIGQDDVDEASMLLVELNGISQDVENHFLEPSIVTYYLVGEVLL